MEGMDRIQANIAALRQRLLQQAEAAADESGHVMASYARGIAPWTNRSGWLRNEISHVTEVTTSVARIAIKHGRKYGPWVEAGTSRARAYPSLWPSVAANTDTVLQIFQRHMRI